MGTGRTRGSPTLGFIGLTNPLDVTTMKKLTVLLILCSSVGWSCLGQESESFPVIHPKVFSMVESWLSDSESPVATEINLDAVSRNGNQFFGSITTNGPWLRVVGEDGHGYLQYRFLKQQGSSYVVEFQSNGGGSLTTSARIGFTVTYRRVEVEGAQNRIQVLRVESYQRTGQPEPERNRLKPAR